MVLVLVLIAPFVVIPVNGVAKWDGGCIVLGVVDGDTIRMNCPRSDISRGRILGYDAPEGWGGCFAERWGSVKAMAVLHWALLRAGRIEATTHGLDRYGRVLVRVSLDGADLSDRMTDAGVARPYGGGRRQGWCG
ncbi:thermonuclease family protein [Jannaschia sp. LMIT008]|uniref:thermonuclease family protein n=1 Tax=Jannaschia maritima TaxID=3032585 RepID=UPI0028120484|nr:thermonuclease family protein [Jannaschia sp. LMIT008]